MLLVLLAIAPFPYGGVLPAGTLRIEVASFTTLAIAFLTTAPRSWRSPLLPIVSLAGIALVGAFQLLPLSEPMLQSLSPASASVHRDADQVIRLFDAKRALQSKISIAPQETANAILLTLAYLSAFIATLLVARTRMQRRLIAWTVVAVAAIQIVATAGKQLESERVSGAFVNPNHFAGYLEIALAVAFGLLWKEILTMGDRAIGARDEADRFERRLFPVVRQVVVWAFIAGGIALSRSRGGVLAALAATAALFVLASIHRRKSSTRNTVLIAAIVAIVIGVGFVAFSLRDASPLSRFLLSDPREIESDTRLVIWKHSVDAWKRYPFFGAGLGAYREAFRPEQPGEVTGLVDYAHSDPLQLLVSAGAIGFTLGALAFISTYIVLLRGLVNQRHREESAMVLGSIGALLSLAIHGIAEFNLSVPAISVTLASVAGLGFTAAEWSEGQSSPGPSL